MNATSPRRTIVPAADLVSLAEIKPHCRIEIEDSESDSVLSSMIAAATAHLDGWAGILGRCMVNQTWALDFSAWPANGVLRLPFPDVSSVVLTYRDTSDAEQTVSAALYELSEDARGSFVRFLDAFTSPSLSDDRGYPVTATLVAGYGAAAADVPAPLRTAAMMLVAHWFENREAATAEAMNALPFAVTTLVAPYRRIRV